jgi:hypothetical protein
MNSKQFGVFGVTANLASIFGFLGVGYSDLSENVLTLIPALIIAIYCGYTAIRLSHKLITSTRPAFDVNNTDRNNLFTSSVFFIFSLTVIIFLLYQAEKADYSPKESNSPTVIESVKI